VDVKTRNQKIIRYNIIGAGMNLVLSLIKIVVGVASGAHAVMLDGVNGLSDMTSSILTILSAVLGGKRSSRKHPMGFGRLEYIFSLIITIIILYIGVRSVISSVRTLIFPDHPPEYDLTVIIIMCISLAAKTFYGVFIRRKGKELNSIAMRMAGTESMGDGLIAAAILGAIAVYKTTHIDIEHYLCIAIGLLIIWTGIRMVVECTFKIVGERAKPEYRHKILNRLLSEEGVQNVYNLVLHNYGEGIYVGSVDVEVDENMYAAEISRLTRRLIRIADQEGLRLTNVGVSAANLSDPRAYEIWDVIINTVRKYESIVGVNSFVVEFDEKIISFYAILNGSSKKSREDLCAFSDELQNRFGDMTLEILDVTDM